MPLQENFIDQLKRTIDEAYGKFIFNERIITGTRGCVLSNRIKEALMVLCNECGEKFEQGDNPVHNQDKQRCARCILYEKEEITESEKHIIEKEREKPNTGFDGYVDNWSPKWDEVRHIFFNGTT